LSASLDSFGPVVWIRPTALPVKSEALITRAQWLGRCQRQCLLGPSAVRGRELRDLKEKPLAKADPAMDGG